MAEQTQLTPEQIKSMKKPGMVIDLNSCTVCKACMISCSNANQTPYWSGKFRTTVEDVIVGEERYFMPRLCQQCEDAPCESVCPTGATYRSEDGIIHVNPDTCIGCKACVQACPYGARYTYNRKDVKHVKDLMGALAKRTVPGIDKCDLCTDRRAEGKEPACVATCMGKARIFGDLADPNSDVSKAAEKAVQIGAEFGTNPRIRYILKEGKK